MPTTTNRNLLLQKTTASTSQRQKGAKAAKNHCPRLTVTSTISMGPCRRRELAVVKRVREFMETKVAPVITDYWVRDAFPFDLLPAGKGN